MPNDEGTPEEFEQWLTVLYGPGESERKTDHRNLLTTKEGKPNSFHRNALRGLAKTRAAEEESKPPTPHGPQPLPAVTPDLAGDVPEPIEGYEDRVDVVGMVKAACTIITAVANWGKPQPDLKIGNRTESIMIRCPFPAHPDNEPSAWINTSKDTWFCGKCQEGGDQLDFYAASQHELSPRSWHDKENFPRIIQEMAEELGLDTEPPPAPAPPPPPEPAPEYDPDEALPMPPPEVPPAPDNEAPSEPPEPALVALEPDDFVQSGDEPGPLDFAGVPRYDWPDLGAPEGSFFYEWMKHTTRNNPTVAEENFIMSGFLALGVACGHHLQQRTPHKGLTNAAMMIVIVDVSGGGKTTAHKLLTELLENGRASAFNDDTGDGVLVFNTPGSPQALMDEFIFQNKATLEMAPINGLMTDAEFATLAARSNQKGGDLFKPRIIEFFDFVKKRLDPQVVMRDRTRTRGVGIVRDSHFSMISTTQTRNIRNQISEQDMDSGFMPRIIPVFGLPRYGDDLNHTQDTGTPPYMAPWDGAWDWCRQRGLCTVMEWAPDVPDYLMSHPIWLELNSYDRVDGLGILSRLKHHAYKMAFLLAVNEGAMWPSALRLPHVECRHFDAVLRFVKYYVHPCYSRFDSAARATDTKDMKDRLLAFIHEYMEKKGVWPDRRALAQKYFWRTAPEHIQLIALESLIGSHLVAEIVLVGPGKSRTKVLIATDRDDHWGNTYKGQHGQPYIKDTFYAKT